jgi:hypothetical protein
LVLEGGVEDPAEVEAQVFFICHTPLVWELADQILTVGHGHVALGNLERGVSGPPSVFPPLPPNNGIT